MFNNIYKNKTALITGHSGFKGSWLALWLTELGANVIGYSHKIPTDPNHISLLNIDIENLKADIRNREKLENAIKKYKPDIIFHLAAQPLVRYSYLNPVETFETNLIGTINIFESSRKSDTVKAIINVTSDKCYENKEWVWGYREIDPLGGYDPYSASKGCSEILTNSYRNSYFNINDYQKKHSILLASARAGNVIGGGDWAEDRLIPDIVRAISRNEELIIRYPQAVRPWQHVLEPLSGYLLLGQKLLEGKSQFAEAWNFGPDELVNISVEKLIQYFQSTWPEVKYKIQSDENQPHEANLLKLDCSKAGQKLKWFPAWNGKQAILKTAKWYQAYYKRNNNLDFTNISLQDLNNYINSAHEREIEWAK